MQARSALRGKAQWIGNEGKRERQATAGHYYYGSGAPGMTREKNAGCEGPV